MKQKKNGFLTFCLALLPGAAHMFMGFFRQGISLMTAFFALIAVGSTLELTIFLLMVPVLWFYSFFDALNKNSQPDSVFQDLEDHYLFISGIEDFKAVPFSKYRTIFAAVIILFGIYLLLDNVVDILELLGFGISYEVYRLLFHNVPQLAIGILIIWLGSCLIRGKRSSLSQKEDIETGGDF